jgi:iron complex transport system permease protein
MLFLFILIAILLSLPHLKGMNLLIGGELYAHSLGVNTKRLKMIIIIASAILAGVVTSFCGPIGFVGLAVPHLARVLLKSTNHLKLLPICFVLGATACLLCSMLASLPFFDMQIPINIITSFIGAPVVIYILYTQKNKFQHG